MCNATTLPLFTLHADPYACVLVGRLCEVLLCSNPLALKDMTEHEQMCFQTFGRCHPTLTEHPLLKNVQVQAYTSLTKDEGKVMGKGSGDVQA